MKDLTGQKFGRLTIIKFSNIKKGHYYWLCQCECGNFVEVERNKLKTGNTKSCGCLSKELASIRITERNIKHNIGHTKIYKIYNAMKQRCYNKNCNAYENYGARGITICNEWLNKPLSFYNWSLQNGYSDNLTIDRIDNNKGYSPDNCRWVDSIIQANNKRNNKYITYNNETHTLAEWCRILKLDYDKTQQRITSYKWDIEKAFNIVR